MNDQDRFEYEYQRLMEDPVVKAELALRDAELAIERLRGALEELAADSKSETQWRTWQTSDNLPI